MGRVWAGGLLPKAERVATAQGWETRGVGLEPDVFHEGGGENKSRHSDKGKQAA